MPGAVALHPPPPVATMNNSVSSTDLEVKEGRATKRRRIVHHGIKYKQPLATETISVVQDDAFFQSQLLRSISLALTAVGFDTVLPSALEAFRAEVETYMLHFLSMVRGSMVSSRRKDVTPQDFAVALAQFGITPSSLMPQVKLPSVPSVTQTSLPLVPPPEESPPSLEALLGDRLSSLAELKEQKYVPKHMPAWPSRHAWQATAIFPTRETDARRIREQAIQEGVMAEQALRRLVAASKAGAHIKDGDARKSAASGRKVWEGALAAVFEADQAEKEREDRLDWDGDGMDIDSAPEGPGAGGQSIEHYFDSNMLVNYDRKYWRESAGGKT